MMCAQCKAAPGKHPVKKPQGGRFTYALVCDACYKLYQAQPPKEPPPKAETVPAVITLPVSSPGCAFCKSRLQTQTHWLCYACWSKVPQGLQGKLDKNQGKLLEAARFAALRVLYQGSPPASVAEEIQEPPASDWRADIERDTLSDNHPYKGKGVADGDKMAPKNWRGK